MGSILDPTLVKILMVELENMLVCKLEQYVLNSIYIHLEQYVQNVLLVLAFHLNVKFTYEKEVSNTLPF